MRYLDGGGLTAEGRSRRARVRLQAAGMYGQGMSAVEVAGCYAPDLNPVEGAWSSMKSSLGNLATCTLDQLAATIRHRLGRIQRQPALIAALLGQTGLTLESGPPLTAPRDP